MNYTNIPIYFRNYSSARIEELTSVPTILPTHTWLSLTPAAPCRPQPPIKSPSSWSYDRWPTRAKKRRWPIWLVTMPKRKAAKYRSPGSATVGWKTFCASRASSGWPSGRRCRWSATRCRRTSTNWWPNRSRRPTPSRVSPKCSRSARCIRRPATSRRPSIRAPSRTWNSGRRLSIRIIIIIIIIGRPTTSSSISRRGSNNSSMVTQVEATETILQTATGTIRTGETFSVFPTHLFKIHLIPFYSRYMSMIYNCGLEASCIRC